MRTLKLTAFGTLAASLALSSGCTFMSGAMLGNALWGDGSVGPGMEPGVAGFTGTSVVCLGTDAELSEAEAAADAFELRGRVIERDWDETPPMGFDNVISCWDHPEQVFEIEDADGAHWFVGYAWLDSGGWDMTPEVWTEAAQVQVLVRRDADSDAAGFVVYDRPDHAIYALESGQGGRALRDGDVPGLSVSEGQTVGQVQSDCGGEALAVDFESADDRLELYPGEDRTMQIDDDYVTVCSIESYRNTEDGCDEADEVSWVVFE